MTSPIHVILEALELVKDKIGKVYHAEALKNASAPFVFWIQSGEDARKALDGYTELKEETYEFHCVAKSLDTLSTQAETLKNSILGLTGTHDSVIIEDISINMTTPTLHEVEVGLYRKVYAVTINYQNLTTGG